MHHCVVGAALTTKENPAEYNKHSWKDHRCHTPIPARYVQHPPYPESNMIAMLHTISSAFCPLGGDTGVFYILYCTLTISSWLTVVSEAINTVNIYNHVYVTEEFSWSISEQKCISVLNHSQAVFSH